MGLSGVVTKRLRFCMTLNSRRYAGCGVHGGLAVAEEMLPMSVYIQGILSHRTVSLAKQPSVVYDTIPFPIPGHTCF
jgi:hypothetical protein